MEDNLYDNLIVAPPKTIIYRSIVMNKFKGRVALTSYSFIIGKELVTAVISHDFKTETTTLKFGKRKQIKHGKLKRIAGLNISMAVPEYYIKIYTSLSADGKTFLLNVNGQSVWRLPYKF